MLSEKATVVKWNAILSFTITLVNEFGGGNFLYGAEAVARFFLICSMNGQS